mgnify:CR=1 FL=1
MPERWLTAGDSRSDYAMADRLHERGLAVEHMDVRPADGVPEKPYGVVTAAILAERGIGDADDVHERAGESLLRWVERDLLREEGTPYGELGLDDPSLSDAALLDAMTAHPILINRPIVVSPKGVRLCRPSEQVLDLLPPQRAAFSKEDGEQVVDAQGNRTRSA